MLLPVIGMFDHPVIAAPALVLMVRVADVYELEVVNANVRQP